MGASGFLFDTLGGPEVPGGRSGTLGHCTAILLQLAGSSHPAASCLARSSRLEALRSHMLPKCWGFTLAPLKTLSVLCSAHFDGGTREGADCHLGVECQCPFSEAAPCF